ncbi:hypothetical protein AB1Y20_000851 [Prymnesium parvum]|uniref:Uncharacterized protein n=1 Tax=Prymnesium parvum TaxID=97485 RepID=A0AB34K605_PRYPA
MALRMRPAHLSVAERMQTSFSCMGARVSGRRGGHSAPPKPTRPLSARARLSSPPPPCASAAEAAARAPPFASLQGRTITPSAARPATADARRRPAPPPPRALRPFSAAARVSRGAAREAAEGVAWWREAQAEAWWREAAAAAAAAAAAGGGGGGRGGGAVVVRGGREGRREASLFEAHVQAAAAARARAGGGGAAAAGARAAEAAAEGCEGPRGAGGARPPRDETRAEERRQLRRTVEEMLRRPMAAIDASLGERRVCAQACKACLRVMEQARPPALVAPMVGPLAPVWKRLHEAIEQFLIASVYSVDLPAKHPELYIDFPHHKSDRGELARASLAVAHLQRFARNSRDASFARSAQPQGGESTPSVEASKAVHGEADVGRAPSVRLLLAAEKVPHYAIADRYEALALMLENEVERLHEIERQQQMTIEDRETVVAKMRELFPDKNRRINLLARQVDDELEAIREHKNGTGEKPRKIRENQENMVTMLREGQHHQCMLEAEVARLKKFNEYLHHLLKEGSHQSTS